MTMDDERFLDFVPLRRYIYPTMKTTVFTSGGSQAVRIPKDLRLDTKNVEIERRGASLILTPIVENSNWPEGYIETIKANAADTDFIRHPQGEHREIIW